MTRNILMLLLFFFVVSCAVGQQVPQRIYAVQSVDEPPVIDGRLDDACWKLLPETSNFTCILQRSGPAEAQTFVQMGQTSTHLIIAFRCTEPDMDKVLKELKGGDDFRESVEVFIDTKLDYRNYKQIRISAGGLREANIGLEQAYRGDLTAWNVSVVREKDAWVVETAIPFSLIGDAPALGECWGVNLNRQRMCVSPCELTCWSNTGYSFHVPEKFGQIIFGSFDDWRVKYSRGVESIVDELKTMIQKYSKSLMNSDELVKQIQPAIKMTQTKITTETDMLKFMEEAFKEQEKYIAILETARLMVIKGEYE